MWTFIQNTLGPLLATISSLIVGGSGLLLIAYKMFQFFGEKWLNAKFEERLENYRHAQQKELEQLRFKINTLMDRTVKLHQREFDVLPETWNLLIEAHGTTMGLVSAFQQYPDVNKMKEDHLEEFLDKS